MLETTVTFEWDPPQGSGPEAVVDNYTISISPRPLSHPCTNVVHGVQSLVWSATLAHNTMYTLNITAVNCEGQSDPYNFPQIEYGKLN